MDKEFIKLLSICSELSQMFDQGLVFIGGIAVYTHSINSAKQASLAEATHDGDFYISLADMADLRDIEEVTPNRRLSKSQIIKGGFEFDIYTERQSSLIVPYDEVIAHSKSYEGVRVACLEHLVVLKLEAYRDRKDSAKGEKDARDLFRLAALVEEKGMDPKLICPYLDDEHLDLFSRLRKSPEASALAGNNAVAAKKLKSHLNNMLDAIEQGFDPGQDDTPAVPKGPF